MKYALLALTAASASALSAAPLRQRAASLELAHISLLRVGSVDAGAAPFDGRNAPVALVEASAGGRGSVLRTLRLSGVTAFSANATNGVGAALVADGDLATVSFVGLSAAPRAVSARALGPVDAVVVSVDYEVGEPSRARLARGAVTVATGAPIAAAPGAGADGGFYVAYAAPGAPLAWFSGAAGAPAEPVAFGAADCALSAPRLMDDPPALYFWSSGAGCGGTGLMSIGAAPAAPRGPASYTAAGGAPLRGAYAVAAARGAARAAGWAVAPVDDTRGAPRAVFVADAGTAAPGLWRFAEPALDSGAAPWCAPPGGAGPLAAVGAALVWLDAAGARVWKAPTRGDECEAPAELRALALAGKQAAYTSVAFTLPSGLWGAAAEGAEGEAEGEVGADAEL